MLHVTPSIIRSIIGSLFLFGSLSFSLVNSSLFLFGSLFSLWLIISLSLWFSLALSLWFSLALSLWFSLALSLWLSLFLLGSLAFSFSLVLSLFSFVLSRYLVGHFQKMCIIYHMANSYNSLDTVCA